MSANQLDKANRFRELHRLPGCFLFPNPWDAGSAKILTGLGFEALATSSSASAGTLGRPDGKISRDESLRMAQAIVDATDLPVAADLENGFGEEPGVVMETIRLAAAVGLVGGSIEDATSTKIYDINHAAERVAAAVEAARALPFPFTLTARADNYFRGNPNLDDTIERLVRYEKAGADVLFAPALPDLDAVRTVCQSVSKPVNFMVGVKNKSFTVPEIVATGAKRISFSASFYRAAMTGLVNAAREAKEAGTFHYIDQIQTAPVLNAFFR